MHRYRKNERMAAGLFDQHSLDAEFDEHLAVALATKLTLADPVAALARQAANRIEAGGKFVFFGNGGSAADAQHLAAELTDPLQGEPEGASCYRLDHGQFRAYRMRQRLRFRRSLCTSGRGPSPAGRHGFRH